MIITDPHPSAGELAAFADDTLARKRAEAVAEHLVGCAQCRDDVIAQRDVRSLLSSSRSADRRAEAAPTQLSDRLTQIAGDEASTPLWLAKSRTGRLPSPRAARRTRALSGSATVMVACAILLGLGYLVAPELPVVRDARQQASREYDLSTGQGAVASAMTAVQAAPAEALDSRDRVASPHVLNELEWRTVSVDDARALLTDRATVGFRGEQKVMLGSGHDFVQARVRVVHRPNEPLHVNVLGAQGLVMRSGVVIDPTPSEQTLVPPGAAEFRTTTGGQIAGQSTTLIESRRHDGSLQGRWWVSEALGLVLWAEAFDPDQTLIRSGGFTSLTLTGEAESSQPVEQLQLSLAPNTVVSATRQMCGGGFSCAAEVAGLPLLQISTDSPTRPRVVHAIYGRDDVRVSVMQQIGSWRGDEGDCYGVTQDRLMSSWQSGRVVYTVTTNGGHALASQVAGELPHERPAGAGSWDRAKAGVRQLFSRR